MKQHGALRNTASDNDTTALYLKLIPVSCLFSSPTTRTSSTPNRITDSLLIVHNTPFHRPALSVRFPLAPLIIKPHPLLRSNRTHRGRVNRSPIDAGVRTVPAVQKRRRPDRSSSDLHRSYGPQACKLAGVWTSKPSVNFSQIRSAVSSDHMHCGFYFTCDTLPLQLHICCTFYECGGFGLPSGPSFPAPLFGSSPSNEGC